MKFSLAAGALFASSVLATPTGLVEKRADLDYTVLQFALTLEHLENVFYKGALKNFTVQDFEAAGYSSSYYNNLMYIAHDEESHVELLEAALTAAHVTPNVACTYTFPYTDVKSFITLSSVIEGVGTAAYLGAAGLITSKTYLTVAGSILITEALHTSYQRAAIGEVPMANPYGTPLDPNSVYTLATAFIVACPSSNAPLPFTAFPGLTYDAASACTCEEPGCAPSQVVKRWGPPGGYGQRPTSTWTTTSATPTPTCTVPTAGATVKFTAAKAVPAGSYLTFVNGLVVTSVKGTISGNYISAAIPSTIEGQTYVLVTNTDVEGSLTDSAVLFGPAIVEVAPPPPSIDYSES